MIDAPMVPANAVKWRDIIAEKGQVLYLINSECHADHTLGNYFFRGTVVSHEETRRSFAKALGTADDVRRKVQERYPDSTELVENYQSRPPTISFIQKLYLHLGDHTFELIHLPGHTLGQIGVYVPQERVIFTGDNFGNGFQPWLHECYPIEWLRSLKTILSLDVDAIVPGHGEVGSNRDVRAFMGFIKCCVDTVSVAIKKGMSKEEAVETIGFEGLLPTRHPGPETQKGNVTRLYEMLSAGALGGEAEMDSPKRFW
jgi:cyclase